MRKGYGPTGASFEYTLADFKEDANARPIKVELVFNGNTATVDMDMTKATDSELKALYDAVDCVRLGVGDASELFTLFTS